MLIEVADAMSDPANRPGFVRLMQQIAHDPQTTVVSADQEWLDRGFVLYRSRLDKKWSLTVCVSFIIMGDLGLADARTGYKDFVQAGFRKLITEEPGYREISLSRGGRRSVRADALAALCQRLLCSSRFLYPD